jgi:hypothetical protein
MRCLSTALCLLPILVGPALAEIPFLNATCPTGIDVHADQGGAVYINGEEATVQSFSDSYYEAKSGGTYVEIGVEGGSVSVTYTAPGGANGVCQVTEAEVGSGGGCPPDVSEADRYKYPACN